MIRVLVISGICLYREGLAELLGHSGSIEVVGTAADVDAGIDLYRTLSPEPDVILLDTTPANSGALVRELRDALRETRILALTVPNRETDVVAIAEAGISGFVTCDASISDLIDAIVSVSRGEALCSPPMTAALIRRLAVLAHDRAQSDVDRALTVREREVLTLIDEGLSNKQIGQQLRIELPTVKNHVHHLLGKLGVQRRSEAAALLHARYAQRAKAE